MWGHETIFEDPVDSCKDSKTETEKSRSIVPGKCHTKKLKTNLP
jgi:hypothetical protein